MARTLTEIQASLDSNITEAITTPSSSQFAEWRIWRAIFAAAIWTFENIMDAFRTEIENKVQSKQPGTLEWYYDRTLEFQGGDESGTFTGDQLIVENGIINYQTPDEDRRIITKAAVTAGSGVVNFKLAKYLSSTTDQALSAAEKTAFEKYMDKIKYPGTTITVISQAADQLDLIIDVYKDVAYTDAVMNIAVAAAVEEYRNSLDFGGRFFIQDLLDLIQQIDGVITVIDGGSQMKGLGAGTWDPVGAYTDLEAGYFELYDSDISYTDLTV